MKIELQNLETQDHYPLSTHAVYKQHPNSTLVNGDGN